MSEKWYYAEGHATHGPVDLNDLIASLTKLPDPNEILVWNASFSDWKPVASVDEVFRQIQRPPPLPSPRLAATEDVRRPAVTEAEAAELARDTTGPRGLSGWLILVGLGQVVGLLKTLASAAEYYSSAEATLFNKFPATMYGEVALNISFFFLLLYATVLFFKKSGQFPKIFIIELLAAVLLPIIDALWVGATLSAYTGQSFSEYAQLDAKDGKALLTSFISAIIWIPYAIKSKRVANTFVV